MLLTVKVTPNAPANALKRYENGILYVAVEGRAEKGEANETLVRFLAKTFGVLAAEIKILSGATGRLKRLKLPVEEASLFSRLK